MFYFLIIKFIILLTSLVLACLSWDRRGRCSADRSRTRRLRRSRAGKATLPLQALSLQRQRLLLRCGAYRAGRDAVGYIAHGLADDFPPFLSSIWRVCLEMQLVVHAESVANLALAHVLAFYIEFLPSAGANYAVWQVK